MFKEKPQRMKNYTGKGECSVNIGKQILSIRKEKQLTQEEFGRLFLVTRQTVSNWENEKKLSGFANACRHERPIWNFS